MNLSNIHEATASLEEAARLLEIEAEEHASPRHDAIASQINNAIGLLQSFASQGGMAEVLVRDLPVSRPEGRCSGTVRRLLG